MRIDQVPNPDAGATTPAGWPLISTMGDKFPLGQIVSTVCGPDGLFPPSFTPEARSALEQMAQRNGVSLSEFVADAVAMCLGDAFRTAGWTFERGDKRSWWGDVVDDGDRLSVGVYRDTETDEFVGVVVTVDQAIALGAPKWRWCIRSTSTVS